MINWFCVPLEYLEFWGHYWRFLARPVGFLMTCIKMLYLSKSILHRNKMLGISYVYFFRSNIPKNTILDGSTNAVHCTLAVVTLIIVPNQCMVHGKLGQDAKHESVPELTCTTIVQNMKNQQFWKTWVFILNKKQYKQTTEKRSNSQMITFVLQKSLLRFNLQFRLKLRFNPRCKDWKTLLFKIWALDLALLFA